MFALFYKGYIRLYAVNYFVIFRLVSVLWHGPSCLPDKKGDSMEKDILKLKTRCYNISYYKPNKKCNCSGPPTFISERAGYQSNQKLLHHYQYSKNQLNS